MCVICIKKKGVRFPSMEEVRTMCDSNPDGFSLIVQHGRTKPIIYKSLNKNKFIQAYKNILKDLDERDSSMFIHARIKTHGTTKIENCHGWKENGLIFAHNGILSIANRDDLTDSEVFFRDIFSPAYKIGGWKLGEKTINAIIGTSKFVFMEDNGEIHHYGNYIDEDGLLFSNTSYKPIRYQWRGYDSWGLKKTQSRFSDWNEDFERNDFIF